MTEPKDWKHYGDTRGGMESPVKALALLVERMRTAQTGFFKSTPSTQARQDYLQDSRKLEKLVDQAVIKILYPMTGDLFPDQGGGTKQIDP